MIPKVPTYLPTYLSICLPTMMENQSCPDNDGCCCCYYYYDDDYYYCICYRVPSMPVPYEIIGEYLDPNALPD